MSRVPLTHAWLAANKLDEEVVQRAHLQGPFEQEVFQKLLAGAVAEKAEVKFVHLLYQVMKLELVSHSNDGCHCSTGQV